MNNVDNILLENINKVHTTDLGVIRIKKNLCIDDNDIVSWCINKIMDSRCNIKRKGKNWYADIDEIVITINAYSYTIITAHIKK